MITITIDGEQVMVAEGTTIMEAAERVNIRIPRLCFLEGLTPLGACGVCVVDVEGERSITRSCVRQVQEGDDTFLFSRIKKDPGCWWNSHGNPSAECFTYAVRTAS